jgi:hypothetical protein
MARGYPVSDFHERRAVLRTVAQCDRQRPREPDTEHRPQDSEEREYPQQDWTAIRTPRTLDGPRFQSTRMTSNSRFESRDDLPEVTHYS